MIKLSYSAVSHIGELKSVNDDRIYASGKFTGTRDTDNIQLSFEGNDNQFIFAVSEGMESDEEIDSTQISVTNELLKFQKKIKNSIKDIQNKHEEMFDSIEQLNNLLYSLTIGNENKKEHKPSFAGLLIGGGKAAAINLGNCRSYKLELDNIRPIVNDYKRTERLLKMGIITDEQAEFLSSQQGTLRSESLTQVKKSEVFKLKENDVILICSNGLIDVLKEESIHEILSSGGGTDDIALKLVKKAVENGAKDNVTAAVIRVLSTDEEGAASKSVSQNLTGRLNRLASNVGNKRIDSSRIISTVVMLIVAAAVVFGTYSLISSLMSDNRTSSAVTGAGTEESNQEGTQTVESDDTNVSDADSEATVESQVTDADGNTVTDTTTAAGTETSYTVKSGDSLESISKKFYGTTKKVDAIMQANKLTNPDKLKIGQILIIPASSN